MIGVVGLALIASHFVSDFVLQSGFVEKRKGLRRWLHGVVVALTCGIALWWLRDWTLSGWGAGVVVGTAVVVGIAHVLQDALVSRLFNTVERKGRPLVRLAVDQAMHLVVLLGIAAASPFPSMMPTIVGFGPVPPVGISALWGVLLLALGTGFAAVLIAHLLEPYRRAMEQEEAREAPLQVQGAVDNGDEVIGPKEATGPRAGLWIGLCERFLLMLAIAVGTDVVPAVGLLMGVKSIYRFRDLDSRVRAEYYLLGTLLSVTAAVVCGIALRVAVSTGLALRLR